MTGPPASPLAVLYVDSDPDLGALAKHVFERTGGTPQCTVSAETSAEAALERLGDDSFDCVVSGYALSEMSGIALLEAVRERHPSLPVVLFSHTEPAQVADSVVRAGLTDYLQKGYGLRPYAMLHRRVGHAVRSAGRFESTADSHSSDDDRPTHDGVSVLGSDERFEVVDEQYASLYAYDATDLVGAHWSTLHPPEEVEHIRRNVLPVVTEGGQWSGHSEGVRADGTRFTESKLVTPFGDGRLLVSVSAADANARPAAGR